MSDHCKPCKCVPRMDQARFLRRASDRLEREIIEAFLIEKAGEHCISKPSGALSETEI